MKMFSGIIVVNSAIYGIAVSLLLCLAAVIIFTGHALLFIILLLTILGEFIEVYRFFDIVNTAKKDKDLLKVILNTLFHIVLQAFC